MSFSHSFSCGLEEVFGSLRARSWQWEQETEQEQETWFSFFIGRNNLPIRWEGKVMEKDFCKSKGIITHGLRGHSQLSEKGHGLRPCFHVSQCGLEKNLVPVLVSSSPFPLLPYVSS